MMVEYIMNYWTLNRNISIEVEIENITIILYIWSSVITMVYYTVICLIMSAKKWNSRFIVKRLM